GGGGEGRGQIGQISQGGRGKERRKSGGEAGSGHARLIGERGDAPRMGGVAVHCGECSRDLRVAQSLKPTAPSFGLLLQPGPHYVNEYHSGQPRNDLFGPGTRHSCLIGKQLQGRLQPLVSLTTLASNVNYSRQQRKQGVQRVVFELEFPADETSGGLAHLVKRVLSGEAYEFIQRLRRCACAVGNCMSTAVGKNHQVAAEDRPLHTLVPEPDYAAAPLEDVKVCKFTGRQDEPPGRVELVVPIDLAIAIQRSQDMREGVRIFGFICRAHGSIFGFPDKKSRLSTITQGRKGSYPNMQ